jgi:hypothetical protein
MIESEKIKPNYCQNIKQIVQELQSIILAA